MLIADQLGTVILKEGILESFDFQDSSTAPEVPGWNSLSHLKILCPIEKEYAMRFRNLEVLQLRTIGDLEILVDRKTGPS